MLSTIREAICQVVGDTKNFITFARAFLIVTLDVTKQYTNLKVADACNGNIVVERLVIFNMFNQK